MQSKRVGIILFENYTLLGMSSKTDTENWLIANKARIIKIFRKFNQVVVFTDQQKLDAHTSDFPESTFDGLIDYLHSRESAKIYKG